MCQSRQMASSASWTATTCRSAAEAPFPAVGDRARIAPGAGGMKRVPVTALTLLAGAGPLAIAVASAAPKAAAAPGATVVYECAGWSGGHVLPRRILVDCAGAVFAKGGRWAAQSSGAGLWADIFQADCA